MYLKQIEIHGFKSFANDTIMTFEKGITGIVGPNGSGKSNIADAVRWVLGEQKVKQLRGSSMQDVIFSGTEQKKAQGFAYVSLTIDNTDRKLALDYDEVQVSRRLYRSGDSEYKINNVDCRLKDINEIFYDTGIGKEGYSIIGQGQIDKILSNKPEDRRELFDEAVGIVKFKRRKAVAEKKLQEEQLNLSRVTDIMTELERQVGPLKRQSESAKEYLSLYENLLLYEANYFIREIEAESKNIDEYNKNISIVSNDLKEANQRKEEFTNKYSEIDNAITKLDLTIAELKDSISEQSSLREKLFGTINVLKEQINSETGATKSRDERISILNNSIYNNIAKIEDAIGILISLKKQIDFIKDNNDGDLENRDAIEVDLSKIDMNLSKAYEDVKRVMGEDYNLDLTRYNEKELFSGDSTFANLNEKRREIEQIDEVINERNAELSNLSKDVYAQNKKITELNNDIMTNQNVFHSKEAKLETIKNMLERYEGYGNTIKSVMDNRQNFKGIKGVVADIFNTDKDYEVAIEVALGNAIQNIVTDNVETAKDIIEFLKQNKLGRVTLLPLSSIKAREDNVYNDALKEKGVINLAVHLTHFSDEFEDLAKYLLARCLVVDSFDNAKEISKKFNQTLKIVTLSGELFNPGGSISGGEYKNSSNLIGRKREYDELKVSIDELKNKIDKLTAERHRFNEEYDSTYNAIEKIKEQINELQIDKNTKTLNILSEVKLEYSTISQRAEYTSNDLVRLLSELDNYFIEKTSLESKETGSSSLIKEKQKEIDDLNNQIEDINLKLKNFENEISEKSSDKDKFLSNRQEYYVSKDKISNDLIRLEQELFKLKSYSEKSTTRIEEITQNIYESYNMTYQSAKEKYREDLGDLADLKKLVKEMKKKIDDLGPININAIEEYKQVSDRYGLMVDQYEDLKKSEEMIAKIVNELDENMRKQFEENFKFIKQEFDKVFKELFGGGKATLELLEVEDKDILDAGVQIVVQPPGKKLGSLSQLSGGEKALTAISLLFAIQNLKPSPFCLLDEIEAALDESNVDRFAGYLKKLVHDTQFILITHRRGTMEQADRLYGVTMQEKGITALVSVNLVEDELTK